MTSYWKQSAESRRRKKLYFYRFESCLVARARCFGGLDIELSHWRLLSQAKSSGNQVWTCWKVKVSMFKALHEHQFKIIKWTFQVSRLVLKKIPINGPHYNRICYQITIPVSSRSSINYENQLSPCYPSTTPAPSIPTRPSSARKLRIFRENCSWKMTKWNVF